MTLHVLQLSGAVLTFANELTGLCLRTSNWETDSMQTLLILIAYTCTMKLEYIQLEN